MRSPGLYVELGTLELSLRPVSAGIARTRIDLHKIRTKDKPMNARSSPEPHMAYLETNEQHRLNEARETGSSVEEVGTVSQREAVGHGSRRLQPGRQRVGLLQS